MDGGETQRVTNKEVVCWFVVILVYIKRMHVSIHICVFFFSKLLEVRKKKDIYNYINDKPNRIRMDLKKRIVGRCPGIESWFFPPVEVSYILYIQQRCMYVCMVT